MLVKNYTNAKRREKRLYTINDVKISDTGIAYGTIYTSFVLLIPFTIIGIIFCIVTKHNWYNLLGFLADTTRTTWFYLIMVGIPIALGVWSNTVKIQNYKLKDYIKILMIPLIPKNTANKRIKDTHYKIDALVKQIHDD